jgi:metal-responsive CopG/Arc/MetJ family transcriptional regulator
MKTQTVNISFTADLIHKIDRIAQKESRSRSELVREASRMYIDRKNRWASIFQFADSKMASLGLSEPDIEKEIQKLRKTGK